MLCMSPLYHENHEKLIAIPLQLGIIEVKILLKSPELPDHHHIHPIDRLSDRGRESVEARLPHPFEDIQAICSRRIAISGAWDGIG